MKDSRSGLMAGRGRSKERLLGESEYIVEEMLMRGSVVEEGGSWEDSEGEKLYMSAEFRYPSMCEYIWGGLGMTRQ